MEKTESCPNCRAEMKLGFLDKGTWVSGGWKTLSRMMARYLSKSSERELAWRCPRCGKIDFYKD